MASFSFNRADPSKILDALARDLSPEQVVSLPLHCDAANLESARGPWFLLSQVLSQPAVYTAFGIDSIPKNVEFESARGLEVIGSLANLLRRGGVHREFVRDNAAALSIAQDFLDGFFLQNYGSAEAYTCHTAWCDWFCGEGILDETLLLRHGDEWWLLAVTGMD